MADIDVEQLIVDLGRYQRRKTVKALLAGNDTGCFTTDQYIDAYARLNWGKDEEAGRRCLRWPMDGGEMLAVVHLRDLPKLVREVSPGVWASVAATDAPA